MGEGRERVKKSFPLTLFLSHEGERKLLILTLLMS
jgi:hypothetical protein